MFADAVLNMGKTGRLGSDDNAPEGCQYPPVFKAFGPTLPKKYFFARENPLETRNATRGV